MAAVHHACDTLTSLGYAEREQIRAAGAAQRILVTTRSLPGTMDIPRPFAPALPDRIESLVSACEQTGRSAEQATAHVANDRGSHPGAQPGADRRTRSSRPQPRQPAKP